MDGNSNTGPEERPVKTLKGLLKFCMNATKQEDATGSTTFEEMSPERKEWLEKALNSMTINTAERLSECLKVIENAEINTEEGTEKILTSLSELQDWVEDLDISQDFITLKGLRVIPGLLSSEVSEIRSSCLELLANLCQNNPRVQAAVLSSHFLPPILLLVDEDPNPGVKVKALYAVSCLARSNILVQTELIAKDGLAVLVRAIESDEEKLRIKASFAISAMIRDNPVLKDVLFDQGLVERMVIQIKKEHCTCHEHLMAAFVSLVQNHPRNKDFCAQEKFDIKSFLTKRIRFLTGKEEFQDELSHAEEFLSILNSTTSYQHSSSAPSMALSLMPA